MATQLNVTQSDTPCWRLLARIDPQTLNLVKFFKPHGRQLYASLNDGRLIAVGDNLWDRLGVGHGREVKTFKEIKPLRGESIKSIVCGRGHTMVLTEDGQVWGWGRNQQGQVGAGDEDEYEMATRILDKDIVDVKCGSCYTLALTQNGKVMGWGYNGVGSIGTGHTDNQRQPVLITYLDGVFIDQIETGSYHSIALSRDGRAFGWGWNKDYRLGVANEGTVLRPVVPIDVHHQAIKSVACSYDETLFLTRDGLMFVTNKYDGMLRQIETGGDIEHIVCINHDMFNQHQESTNNNAPSRLFIAWTSTAAYYWGDTQRGEEEKKPKQTDLSLSQIISQHSQFQAFPAVLYLQQEEETIMMKSTAKIQHPLDIIEFVFPEHRTIRAHRVILSGASHFMSTQLSGPWKCLSRVSITSHPHSVFHHYLSYLYTHTLSTDDIDQLVPLVHLAHDYRELDLQNVCVRLLSNQLNIDNCSQVYELATDVHLEQLEQQSRDMIIANFADVCLTDAFKNMSGEKVKELLSLLLTKH